MTYKRTIFLINPRFQLKFSLLISVIVFISSLIYPIVIYNLITNYRNNITRNLVKICENEKKEIASISKSVSGQRENLIYLLIFGQLIFTGLIFIISIFFSLKIAGPIYKTQKYLKSKKIANLNINDRSQHQITKLCPLGPIMWFLQKILLIY